MRRGQINKTLGDYLWRMPLCALVYVAGTMMGGAVVSALGMKVPAIPDEVSENAMGVALLVASFALAVGVVPLARRIRAAFWVRGLSVAVLCYVCIGVNTPIEAAIFTTMGGMASVAVLSILPCLLFGAAVALLFRPTAKHEPFRSQVSRFFAGRSVAQWVWRFAAAICAFPLIYWLFGMMVAPFVMEYYRQGTFGLTIPHPAVILLVQLLRSSLFLLAAFPILLVWSGSRRQLTLVLGFAFFVLVGLYGFIQSYWLAQTVLVIHNVEILADSVVYAWVLAILFVRQKRPTLEAKDNPAGLPPAETVPA